MKTTGCTGTQSGSALVIVLVVTVVMLIGAMAVLQLGAQDAVLAMRDVRVSEAFYAAEAGAERGEAWLVAQSSYPTAAVTPFSGTAEPFADGLYHVTVTPDYSTSRTFYTITSYATVQGRSRALEVDVTPTAFTDYLYYTNSDQGFGGPGYFRTGDTVDGPIRVNTEIAIWGDPVFLDKVQSAESTILYHNDWSPVNLTALSNPPHDEPDFQAGCELGVLPMPWLDQTDLHTIRDMAGISLGGNHDIIFGRDAGSGPMLGYVSYSQEGQNSWTDVLISSFNGIVYGSGQFTVSGIVDGQVTLASNDIMSIVDDITYADSDANGPRPGCDDILGLIAGSKLRVVDNVPNGTDCVIHAHMIAVANQASLVEYYDQGVPRGTLTIYGGMAQDKWGPVGTGYYDAEGNFVVLTGYERDIHYDWRLRTILPPGYEYIIFGGTELERLAWREIAAVDLTQG
ncbi:MAG: PilX N-terminal domain-containing pilus assembly protein [Candidatus Eisenbacteria bacterium]